MDCPHCERLKRLYSSEAEREARAILAQRSSWLGMTLTLEGLDYDGLQSVVNECRKKEAQISSEIREHELAHCAVA
jgi:hypothetical protein